MNDMLLPKRIAICEICGKDILEGQGNIAMYGATNIHYIHISHEKEDYQDYRKWRNFILTYRSAY